MVITLVCYISLLWTPPSNWTVHEIRNGSNWASVTLTREVKSGEIVEVPAGCETKEPEQKTYLYNNGTMFLIGAKDGN